MQWTLLLRITVSYLLWKHLEQEAGINLIALPNTIMSHLKFIVMTVGNILQSAGRSRTVTNHIALQI